MDASMTMDGEPLIPQDERVTGLLSLPAELRVYILEYVFHDPDRPSGLLKQVKTGRLVLDDCYSANQNLAPLLVCRQLYQDSGCLGFKTTTFLVASLFGDIPKQLSILKSKQVESIRNITFVADGRQFRKIVDWKQHAFDITSLRLDTLTIALHRSSPWHYLYDYTGPMVQLLRRLQGVRRLAVVRNDARVKGSLHAWYNRLVGLMLKIDHQQRYETSPPNPEQVWWEWSFDSPAQRMCLEARPPKPLVDEEEYIQNVLPLMEELRDSVENEEWNPDPRSRYMYY
jgi:hypothetical protein